MFLIQFLHQGYFILNTKRNKCEKPETRDTDKRESQISKLRLLKRGKTTRRNLIFNFQLNFINKSVKPEDIELKGTKICISHYVHTQWYLRT